ncbi:hypothetical protein GGS21DRAFT_377963 [Xylaria nigripes]|nr:hypothetical protein GGS21DRAFT_377963 [Xylaria nigripes]
MCFDHGVRNTLGGGLAVLSPCFRKIDASRIHLAGRLVFHDRGKGSSTATHAMFMADMSNEPHSNGLVEPCLVRIHETGDLTSPAMKSPSWAAFYLKPIIGASESDNGQTVEVELERPLRIEVGTNGIIGRRVSVWTQQGVEPIAEGIIGYN